jgi:hypothetical protein
MEEESRTNSAHDAVGECLSCEELFEELRDGSRRGGLALDIDETLAWTGEWRKRNILVTCCTYVGSPCS